MFDIVSSADLLFGKKASYCREILLEFVREYRVRKDDLPDVDGLIAFLRQRSDRDKISITITTDNDNDLVCIGVDDNWIDQYTAFANGLYDDDDVTIVIKITKVNKEGRISIYNLCEFSKFLCGLATEQVFENFTELFAKCGEHIIFQLFDTNGSFRTKSVAFTDNDVQWIDSRNREEYLKDCEDASIFLERTRIRLTPQDFSVISMEGNGFEQIMELFGKLKIILSYVYLANTASIVNGKAVLQFDPSTRGYEYELDQISVNKVVPQIFDWVFKNEGCVDKASIARKIISVYCRSEEEVLTINEKVLNSIKSDYVIYQKNHVDQYIDMKNKISGFIVDSAERIQELSHDLADAFRNNFVAIIIFLMTVLLTDSIDFTQFFGREVSPKVTAVCAIFTIATLLYFVATILMGNQKWSWLKQSYDDLKKNYNGVFDSKDIEESFNNDEPLNHAEKQYKGIRMQIGAIWIVLIVAMALFTGVLMWQGYNIFSQQISINEVESISTEENAIDVQINSTTSAME